MKEKIKKVLTGYEYGINDIDYAVDEIINAIIIPVDKDNLPKEKVVAFEKDMYTLTGIISKYDDDGTLYCEDEDCNRIQDIAHYMEIPKLWKENYLKESLFGLVTDLIPSFKL